MGNACAWANFQFLPIILQVLYLFSVMSKVGFAFVNLELGVPAVILARSNTLDSHRLDAGKFNVQQCMIAPSNIDDC